MFNAWVGGLVDFFGGSIYDLFYMRWWLWFFEWSLAASVFGVYTLVIEAGDASMWQWSLCFAPVDMIKLMNHLELSAVIAELAVSGLNDESYLRQVLRKKTVCARCYWEIWEQASPALCYGL
jgi:hypothetical protein